MDKEQMLLKTKQVIALVSELAEAVNTDYRLNKIARALDTKARDFKFAIEFGGNTMGRPKFVFDVRSFVDAHVGNRVKWSQVEDWAAEFGKCDRSVIPVRVWNEIDRELKRVSVEGGVLYAFPSGIDEDQKASSYVASLVAEKKVTPVQTSVSIREMLMQNH